MQERRKSPRTRSLRHGKILPNNKRSVISCTVRNLSATGAKLEVQSALGIPAFFELLIEGETASRACDLMWRADKSVGVAFHGTAAAQGMSATATVPSPQPDPERVAPIRSEVLALRAALDEVRIGIVLLDAGLRAQVINRAFRQMWRLSNAQADSKPAFVTLMYHGRDTRAYDVPDEELDAYIERRVAHVRAGEPEPLDLRLTNGEVIRFQCAKLPAGGRMLSYTYVTDIVRHADELQALRAGLNSMEQGIILLDADLKARFMNTAVRRLWQVSDAEAEGRPAYAELVKAARKSGVYGVSPENLDAFIARRISLVAAGDPRPMDIRASDGRIVRSQCSVLPAGGRLLTYTDVTDLVRRSAELERLATTDATTGVHNRRHFQALLASEWHRVARYSRPLSLLMINVDHFRRVNDRFGQDIGDRVLAHIARLCTASKRASDIVARTGGDEFAMLLPETNAPEASVFAERLRQIVIDNPLPELAGRAALSISIGIAGAHVEVNGAEDLMNLANSALVRAKLAGRNCVARAVFDATDEPATAAPTHERRAVH